MILKSLKNLIFTRIKAILLSEELITSSVIKMLTNSQSIENCANGQELRNFKEKAAIYLKLISEATRMLNLNMGSLRRDIWAYLLKEYGREDDTVDYRDFLHSIRHLIYEGKLLSN